MKLDPGIHIGMHLVCFLIPDVTGLLPVLHRSDRLPAAVRPVDRASQAGGYNSRTTNVPERLSDFSRPGTKTPQNVPCKEGKPYTKPNKTTPIRPRTNQQHHSSKTHESHPRQIPQVVRTGQEHRSDRCNLGSSG
jgi:hypothetical protein